MLDIISDWMPTPENYRKLHINKYCISTYYIKVYYIHCKTFFSLYYNYEFRHAAILLPQPDPNHPDVTFILPLGNSHLIFIMTGIPISIWSLLIIHMYMVIHRGLVKPMTY